ncbi:MAG: hypothetical protein ACREJD_09510 [Phycisphaerales bacterium]
MTTTTRRLVWIEEKEGIFVATSRVVADGRSPLRWRIDCPRGPRVWFQLAGDTELYERVDETRFDTLIQAQEAAQGVENALLAELLEDVRGAA